MRAPKEFKSLDEQCNIILNERKLKLSNFNDYNQNLIRLKKELQEKNYFDLINGLDNIIDSSIARNKYYGNYSIDNLLDLYDFNKKIREFILSTVSTFEIRLKTSIAYHFCERYSEWDDYRKIENYKSVTRNDTDELYFAVNGYPRTYFGDNPIINYRKVHPFLNIDAFHSFSKRNPYLNSYNNHPPLWITVKALNFGELHILFSLLKENIAEKVLKDFSLKLSERSEFESVLYVINWLRNECAHFQMINQSKFKGKYAINSQLMTKLNIITNRSAHTLDMFSCLKILDFVQPLKYDLIRLSIHSDLPRNLIRKYYISIGYSDF